MTMTNAIAATRAAIGISCWATPVLASRLFCIDITNDQSGKFYLKLGGTRDLALAAGTATITAESKSQMLRIAAACDIGDMVAAVITHRDGQLSAIGTALWLTASAACLGMTVKAMGES